MALPADVLGRLIADAQSDEKQFQELIKQYEDGVLFTQQRSGNDPWVDTTASDLAGFKQDLQRTRERLARYNELKDAS